MAMKSIILITALVAVLVATQAQAQFNFPGVGSRLNISGILSCSANASVNGTNPIPPFPNAVVQLVCGGNVVATTTTNGTGAFSIFLSQFQALLSTILSNCILRVPTPLSNCNATLPSNGTLQAPIQFLGNSIRGVLNFTSGPFTRG
ncbi:putative phylloplanin [Helianthus annuus]|nr:putative phylloplanin [Helianthus annuus]KAJ0718154.1 putative phylloplanin [Helianthus annuus]KAJ0763796.1 putative phylloplanin [Helianthus annuus]KAJ0900536.1 putative phylloplanin [Helianthus annuus]